MIALFTNPINLIENSFANMVTERHPGFLGSITFFNVKLLLSVLVDDHILRCTLSLSNCSSKESQ